MKQCPFCGADISENAKFCVFCMSNLQPKEIIKAKRNYNLRWLYLTAALILFLLFVTTVVNFIVNNTDVSKDDDYIVTEIINEHYGTTTSQEDSSDTNESSIPVSSEESDKDDDSSNNIFSSNEDQSSDDYSKPESEQNESTVPPESTNPDTENSTPSQPDDTPEVLPKPEPEPEPEPEPDPEPEEIDYTQYFKCRLVNPRTDLIEYYKANIDVNQNVTITEILKVPEDGVVVIPSQLFGFNVVAIDKDVFADSSVRDLIKKVYLPDTIHTLNDSTFYYCHYITDIYITNSTGLYMSTTALSPPAKRKAPLTVHAYKECINYFTDYTIEKDTLFSYYFEPLN